MKLALTGNVALELIAPYFREAGFEVLSQDALARGEIADVTYDVTSHETILANEIEDFYDLRMEKLAGCRFSLNGIKAIVEEFRFELLKGNKKILAVDADNTLWKGILSEDGKDALVPYEEFQSGLKALRDDGAVLVLLSKNDSFTIDWFTLSKVNWAPKAGNLIEACKELNLSTDSVVFIDDNPYERAQMAAHLPEVTIAPFPEDMSKPTQFLRRLKEYFFSSVGTTDEDRLRAKDYAVKRPSVKEYADIKDYLKDLELKVMPSIASETDLDRLAQMAGKTNQFNATTIRRSREDFAGMISDLSKRVYVFRAADRFGEQGLVCYIVVNLETRRITDFVMSCRAMGRTLEHFALMFVERDLKYRPEIDFVATAKNAPFKAFLDSLKLQPLTTYYVSL